MPTDGVVEPLADEPLEGAAAFSACHDALLAIEPAKIQTPRCDCVAIANAALALATHLDEPRVREQLQLIPAALMGDATADRLRVAATALFYLDTRSRTFLATRATKRVEPDLVARGVEVRDRMLRVLTYHKQSQPLMMAEIASIKSGTGYMDLASDLTRLAGHYGAHKKLLSRDRVQYDAADEDLAKGIANAILRALSATEDRTTIDLRNRAYTLTARIYGRLKEAGDFIYADQPTELAKFPPLRKAAVPSIGRPKGSKKRVAESDSTEPTGDERTSND